LASQIVEVKLPANPQRYAARQLEDLISWELEKIPGVLAATIWLRNRETIREVYVTGAPGTSLPVLEQAVTAILRGYGLAFTPAQLHTAPIDGAVAPPPLWNGRFLILDNIETTRAEHQVTCHIRILRGGKPASGEARDVDTDNGRARAAAQATLRAAERAANGVAFGLEGLHIPELFGRRYVILSIDAALARRPSLLPGIAAVTQSTEHAAAIATLGAIERWLSW
jgi:hypothetical protein